MKRFLERKLPFKVFKKSLLKQKRRFLHL